MPLSPYQLMDKNSNYVINSLDAGPLGGSNEEERQGEVQEKNAEFTQILSFSPPISKGPS